MALCTTVERYGVGFPGGVFSPYIILLLLGGDVAAQRMDTAPAYRVGYSYLVVAPGLDSFTTTSRRRTAFYGIGGGTQRIGPVSPVDCVVVGGSDIRRWIQ